MGTQGTRLKKIRQELNLSQEDMGNALGFSRQYLSNLENDRDILNNEKLVKLFQTYNVSIDWLLSGNGNMFRDSAPQPNEELRKIIKTEVADLLNERGL